MVAVDVACTFLPWLWFLVLLFKREFQLSIVVIKFMNSQMKYVSMVGPFALDRFDCCMHYVGYALYFKCSCSYCYSHSFWFICVVAAAVAHSSLVPPCFPFHLAKLNVRNLCTSECNLLVYALNLSFNKIACPIDDNDNYQVHGLAHKYKYGL